MELPTSHRPAERPPRADRAVLLDLLVILDARAASLEALVGWLIDRFEARS